MAAGEGEPGEIDRDLMEERMRFRSSIPKRFWNFYENIFLKEVVIKKDKKDKDNQNQANSS